MRRTLPLLILCFFIEAGCSSAPEKEQSIRFLIPANEFIDRALIDGRLPALVFAEQTPAEFAVTRLEEHMGPVGSPAFGLKPGTYPTYQFPVIIGRRNFKDASIFLEKPLAVKGKFRLGKIQHLGLVTVAGTKGNNRFNGEPHNVFSATVDTGWKGTVENKAGPENPEIETTALDQNQVRGEIAKLRGTWKCISVETGDVKSKKPLTLGIGEKEIKVTGQLFLDQWVDERCDTYTFLIDPSRNPKEIDFRRIQARQDDSPHLGIYSLEGQTLRFCSPLMEGMRRPTVFSGLDPTTPGKRFSSMVFQRMEK